MNVTAVGNETRRVRSQSYGKRELRSFVERNVPADYIADLEEQNYYLGKPCPAWCHTEEDLSQRLYESEASGVAAEEDVLKAFAEWTYNIPLQTSAS